MGFDLAMRCFLFFGKTNEVLLCVVIFIHLFQGFEEVTAYLIIKVDALGFMKWSENFYLVGFDVFAMVNFLCDLIIIIKKNLLV